MFTVLKWKSFWWHLAFAIFWTYIFSETLQLDYSLGWFAGVNFVSFTSFGWDKFRSMGNGRRTPEMTYHALGLLGGFPGIFAGRKLFNHKTGKLGFIVPMWLLFFAQILFVGYHFGGLDKVFAKWQNQKQVEQTQQVEEAHDQW